MFLRCGQLRAELLGGRVFGSNWVHFCTNCSGLILLPPGPEARGQSVPLVTRCDAVEELPGRALRADQSKVVGENSLARPVSGIDDLNLRWRL